MATKMYRVAVLFDLKGLFIKMPMEVNKQKPATKCFLLFFMCFNDTRFDIDELFEFSVEQANTTVSSVLFSHVRKNCSNCCEFTESLLDFQILEKRVPSLIRLRVGAFACVL